MKANAPEKIYIKDFGDKLSFGYYTKQFDGFDIEYTRTDAFIEKACNAYCKVCKMTNCRSNECKWISEFKEHLETI